MVIAIVNNMHNNQTKHNLSIDLGAFSVRIILNKLENNTLTQKVVHRFNTHQIIDENRIYWDYQKIFKDMLIGISKIDVPLESIGIDGWGVDFAYLDDKGEILSNIIAYRDPRTQDIWDVKKLFDPKIAFKKTGMSNSIINTSYQINRDDFIRPEIVKKAKYILNISDLFNYLFTGQIYNEYSVIKTSQIINSHEFKLDEYMVKQLKLENLKLKPIHAGQVIGNLKDNLLDHEKVGRPELVVVSGHDTASALIPLLLKPKEIFIALGSWSIIGTKLNKSVMGDNIEPLGFSNEGTYDGKIKFLKNVNGLYLLQSLKKTFDNKYDFSEIATMASKSDVTNIFDPNDVLIMNENVPLLKRLNNYYKHYDMKELTSIGDFAQSIYLSLINSFKNTIKDIEEINGWKYTNIKLFGGGIQDKYLIKLINDTFSNVSYSIIEASAIGNSLLQFQTMDDNLNVESIQIKES